MQQDVPVDSAPLVLIGVLVLALLASIAIWLRLWWHPEELDETVPHRPRNPVPWNVLDVMLVLLLYAGLTGVGFEAVEWLMGEEADRRPAVVDVEQSDASHPVARLIQNGGLGALALAIISAAIVAPIVEEFLFRVLLQGWLERVGAAIRPRAPTFRHYLPRGLGPVALAAFLFAMLHFRVDAPAVSVRFLCYALAANAVASVLVMIIAVGLLKARCGASAEDFGWQPGAFWGDVRMGLWAFLATAAPIYLLQASLAASLPAYVSVDPLTLFPVALVLGTLYFRTHRLLPAITYHMALNSVSLAMALYVLRR